MFSKEVKEQQKMHALCPNAQRTSQYANIEDV